MENKVCKCGITNCLGFILLHEKELENIDEIKVKQLEKHGNVQFKLTRSPSSGEIFTKFYELHILKNMI